MDLKSSVLSILLQVIFNSNFGTCEFATDWLGNLVSDDEYNNQEFCNSEVCLRDSGRLIYSASHDSAKINPCDDFPTFAMGEFLEHRVPNERYPKLGFYSDIEAQFFEKQKQILIEPINSEDLKIFKVLKSFFTKCKDSCKFRGLKKKISFNNII